MTPAELKSIRKSLGLSARGLAAELGLGEWGGRTVRRWESGENPISRITELAIRYVQEKRND